jgi:hypothetical protein
MQFLTTPNGLLRVLLSCQDNCNSLFYWFTLSSYPKPLSKFIIRLSCFYPEGGNSNTKRNFDNICQKTLILGHTLCSEGAVQLWVLHVIQHAVILLRLLCPTSRGYSSAPSESYSTRLFFCVFCVLHHAVILLRLARHTARGYSSAPCASYSMRYFFCALHVIQHAVILLRLVCHTARGYSSASCA